jgi:catechol 2,3-dioxygenase-like lactoylglutathione lyase family enzyme
MDMPYVHIGFLVDDLDAAIERHSKLGVAFMEPRTVHVDRLVEDGRESEVDLRIVFSQAGPPHWELLEATGDGIYGPQHVGGLHHVAVLTPDAKTRRDELIAQGFREVATQYRPDGSVIVSCLDPADLYGIRIEVLDAATQDAILAWVSGKDATP